MLKNEWQLSVYESIEDHFRFVRAIL